MTNKLDQSLDEILKDRRQTVRHPRPRHAANGGRATVSGNASHGGVKKMSRTTKSVGKPAPPTGPSGSGDSKIIVSNLPSDVSESQIKDFFGKTIAPIKKVTLTYGPNGQSRGICTIIFTKPGSAAEAAKNLDGVKVDGRPMKVEVVVGANQAPAPFPVKSLHERISQPRSAARTQSKPAPGPKGSGSRIAGRGRGKGRGRIMNRTKPKTTQELDAEMQDYFESTPTGASDPGMQMNGGPAHGTANDGDAGMDEEIL